MYIKISGKTYNVDSRIKTNEDILGFINDRLWADNLVLTQLLVDGKSVKQNYEDYILNQLSMNNNLEIFTVSRQELINDMKRSARDYLDQSIPQIYVLVDEFYAGPKNETWNRFDSLIEALQWMVSFTDELENTECNSDFSSQFCEIIQSLGAAVQSSDPIQIGDIVQYELLPLLDKLKLLLQNENEEVLGNGLN